MSTKYTVRVASPVAYEYWEATSDSYEEMLAAEQELRELKDQAATDGAVETVKKTFGKTTEQPAKKSGFGSSQQSLPDKIELGEHEGYTITLNKGKRGWYANAYNFKSRDRLDNKSLPKGVDPGKFTLSEAIELWSE